MFNTLKRTNGASEYVVEPSDPPFNKRQKILARVACAYCREKKVHPDQLIYYMCIQDTNGAQLKCSGELEGCQRCLARSIECTYLSSRASPITHRKQPSATITTPSDTTNLSALSPETVEIPLDVELMWDRDDVWNYTAGSNDMQWSDPVVFDSTGLVTLEDTSCMDTFIIDAFKSSGSSSTVRSTNSGGCRSPPSYDTPSTLLSEPTLSFCDCVNHLLLQNEKLSVTLFARRTERKPSLANIFTDGIWQCQKGSMASCEALLGCDACSSRSELVTQVIRMCDMIMGSIEDMHLQLTSNDQLEDDVQSEQSLGRNARAGGKISWDIMSGNVEHGRLRSQSLSQWNLDDEELHILQGLLNSRVVRLGSLLTKIRQITVAKQWLDCEIMNESIRKRHGFVSTIGRECRTRLRSI
ncbi:hypothetical protein LZ32DRAFT_684878 [Colletotrichum eremochloae]|nr:hypothetical protein LZ32DRAFT_684878 [Colletotrichum eremochloae]